MGGKTWSNEEERYFWRTLVPLSPQAADPATRRLTWDRCAINMQQAMGEPRRRTYTRTMLYEHYYQNIKTRNHSPRARDFVFEHLQDIEAYQAAEEEDDEDEAGEDEAEAASSRSGEDLVGGDSSPLLFTPFNPSNVVVGTRKREWTPSGDEPVAKRHRAAPIDFRLCPDHSSSVVQSADAIELGKLPTPSSRLPPMDPYPVNHQVSSAFLDAVCHPPSFTPQISDRSRTALPSQRPVTHCMPEVQNSAKCSGIASPSLWNEGAKAGSPYSSNTSVMPQGAETVASPKGTPSYL